MSRHDDKPNKFDVVMGNQTMISDGSMVLGGIEKIIDRLDTDSIQLKILALKDAVHYGKAGLLLVLEHLEHEQFEIQNVAYSLLEFRSEPFIRERIAKYPKIVKYTRHSNRFELFEQMGRAGTPEDVDIMMESLELDPISSPHKLIDYTLGLVKNIEGQLRIEHYLFNGTQVQRNYSALYFKRIGAVGMLTEAVEMGCIDRVQAFSK
jgi:hypothetical protein